MKPIPPTSFLFPETTYPQAHYANHASPTSAHAAPTLASKLIILANKTLKRVGPTEISPKGKSRVVIPDEVFSRGADEHKNFIVGSFLGKLPTKDHIQSIVNYMWGKGKHLEVHLNPLARTILVRIPNEFIRKKVLDHKVWHIGSSMFHVAQWSATTRDSIPILKRVPIWTHVAGIPFDLMAKEGLCYVAGLIGEPVEMDDYTKNLTSLNIAHLKVEVDVTKPMPPVVEIVRTSEEIIPVTVEYHWLPSSCSNCKEVGHFYRNFPKFKLAWLPKNPSLWFLQVQCQCMILSLTLILLREQALLLALLLLELIFHLLPPPPQFPPWTSTLTLVCPLWHLLL